MAEIYHSMKFYITEMEYVAILYLFCKFIPSNSIQVPLPNMKTQQCFLGGGYSHWSATESQLGTRAQPDLWEDFF